jgi:hypothetical protein
MPGRNPYLDGLLADTIRWSSALGWLCKDLNTMIGSAG